MSRISNFFKRTVGKEACLKDLKSPAFWVEVVVEMTATVILVLSVLLMSTSSDKDYKPNVHHFGVGVVLIIFVIVEAFGPLCGANVNPAVSIGLLIGGRITIVRAMAYISVQIIASLIATGLALLMVPSKNVDQFKALSPVDEMNYGQAVAVEAFYLFIIVITIMSVTDPALHRSTIIPGLAIGSALGACVLIGGTHSGSVLNPIVSLAPAIMTRDFVHHSIYWFGPVLGAILGALFYNLAQFLRSRFAPAAQKGKSVDGEKTELALVSLSDKKEEMVRLLEEFLRQLMTPPNKPADV